MGDVRPAPFFVGDSAALDFLNSIAMPRSVEFEWLASGADVLDWLVQSGLAREEEISDLRQPRHRPALDLAANDIRAFREEFRAFVCSVSDKNKVPADHPMIERVNHLMQAGDQSLHLVSNNSDGGEFMLNVIHRMQTAEDLLPRIAAACAELIAEADFTHVRRCQGSGCTMFFRDVSKNHKRRWCSMELCGNRAKAAAYRSRS